MLSLKCVSAVEALFLYVVVYLIKYLAAHSQKLIHFIQALN